MMLLTGATGLIGGYVSQALRNREVRHKVLLRDPGRAGEFEALGVECAVGDLDRAASLTDAVRGARAVLLVSPSNPDMVRQQSALVETLLNHGRPDVHVVKISGFLTGLHSSSLSGRWHAQIEAKIQAAGLAATHLRLPFLMQNLLRMRQQVLNAGVVRAAVGEAKIAMLDARDLAQVAVACLLHPAPEISSDLAQRTRHYLVTGPNAVGFEDVAAGLTEALASRGGSPVAYQPWSFAEEERAQREAGAPGWRIGVVLEFMRAFARGEGAPVSDSLRTLTGTRGRSLAEFIDDHLDHFSATETS